ncbi:lysine-specific demethylase JMJ32 [Andrographis paniculata]|uniref:lysine-specific demethylase JMJ32 n=1 Tax=Andrographis paniculata TaxID=175694 RepID=UPI0021E6F75C|nr:lysine-specific demethylase JMJ32 [Andrographis paniculata]
MEEALHTLWDEVRDLSLSTAIDCLPTPPTPLRFLRHYVLPNKPCLIAAAVPHWPALSLWPSNSYLRSVLSDTDVSVHLTPSGKADALVSHPGDPSAVCFASAAVRTVAFPEALDLVVASKEGKAVAYLQQQNDCFRSEYGALAADCEEEIPWASEALGCAPEAVNLWIGNRLSETWFHKDHYENLYVVIAGEKRFLLLPPTDVHRMYVRDYQAARYRYCQDSGDFTLELEDPTAYVPWCSVDPCPSFEEEQREIKKFPLYFNGPKPFEVTVKAGEMLYLPSMWFHHVQQSQDDSVLTIAINYWYDMQFDIKYAYFNFLQSIPYSPPADPSLSKNKDSSLDESDIISDRPSIDTSCNEDG